MKILLLEPDAVLAQLYQTALEAAGHDVTWTQSAQSAVHQIDTDMPDVVITELQIARHNGVEFLYELRSYTEWQHIPVIIHSQVPPHEAPMMADLGIAAYHYKPATKLATLVRSVNEIALHTV
jgi:DNA-binding response OmpR family regulator